MKRNRNHERGQIIPMVALALFAMCGLLALSVDLGWSYFVKKAAQGAADAASISAAVAGQALAGGSPPYACSPTGLDCTSGGAPVSCSSISNTSNLFKACQYAQNNGFQDGADRISVTVAANVCSGGIGCPGGGVQPPTVTNVNVNYWVTVRVTQTVPQLFSAMVGNPNATVSSRATAAIAQVVFEASITLLNRQNDPNPDNGTGVDFNLQGNGNVQAPGGMLVSSSLAGAAIMGGNASVTNTPFSYFRDTGTCLLGNGNPCDLAHWSQLPTSGRPDGSAFQDPTSLSGGIGQPPLQAVSTDLPVNANFGSGGSQGKLQAGNPPGATGSGNNAGDPVILPPGNYYTCTGSPCVPNGAQIPFDNNKYYAFQGGSFDQYTFYGGLTTTGGNANIRFGPGAYVFAGTTGGNPSFYVDNGTTITDANPGNGNYPGEIFIYTNGNSGGTYGGSLLVPPAIAAANLQFGYSETGIKTGNNPNSSITLTGLDRTNAPAAYQAWAPYVMWQDRGNSYIQYNINNGAIVGTALGTDCSPTSPVLGVGTLTSIDNPCRSGVPLNSTSPRMHIQATPSTHLSGAIYQPRGAWLSMNGSGTLSGPLKIITGAITMQGGPGIILNGLGAPITVNTVALIE